ncbi:MAG: UDP-N-acetylmuramate dehydrogenase [Alphaproteobacteria bacterium]|nr:UDP-N-acetylmuramate dehydrogenase [Alphaproteobacteria bacterium]
MSSILEKLPEVRGKYTENASLGEKGWFRCGGKAEVLFKPADVGDLQHFLKNCPSDVPVQVFGALSNSIIRDGGLKGVTIRLNRSFADIKADGETVTAGALALDANVARMAAEAGIGGLEFLSGIPGTIGGALKMNAGCYGTEINDVLVEATLLDRQGNRLTVTPADLDMTYRHTNIGDDMIVVSATFKGTSEDARIVKARIEEIKTRREESQPIREKTGGSTFANPSATEIAQAGLPEGTKVWQLIDSVGGRGLTIGGAQMSEKHCNFMINTGDATAADLEALGEEIRARVLEKHGIALRWEIRRIGEANE